MIRKYETRDTDELVAIWRRASAVAHPFLSKDFVEQEAENTRNLYLPNAETWVFEKAGRLVGFIALLGNEVGGFFVDPFHQGQGHGQSLMDHAVQLKGDLCVDVFSENPIGRRFYSRYGFREEGEHHHEASGHMLTHMTYSNK
ncbi:GNAT family N-acetyltransferase [Paremcibacter congregatus]|uniref:GNAT family N-acetyltransferase n=1 Tax=Paremcibacter congregatus TaxID=2043170 RepID=UPI0030ED5E31|tara:strand:- start:3567 stop:3995 length:429 start_codon:yes stop_codon:yes gene_type:complete